MSVLTIAHSVATAFVALEDGLGRQVIGSNPGVDRRKALELLGRFATLAVGAEIDPLE